MFFGIFARAMPVSASLVLDVAADMPVVESGAVARIVVRALVRPEGQESPRRKRAPLAIAIVLDKSGSMQAGGKMENAKKGAVQALEYLDSSDAAALVVYDDEARVLTPLRAWSEEAFDSAVSAISEVRAGGSTALYDGVALGAEKILRQAGGRVPRILLLSDGMANVGPSSARELAAFGRKLAGREMTITTIGLGLDYNEDLMTALAAESGGNSYFVRNASSLPEIFALDMEDASSLTARHVSVTLTCRGGTIPVKALGRKGSERGNSIAVPIDNVYGKEKYALFELEIPQQADGASLDAASILLEYEDAASGKKHSQEVPLELRFTKNRDDVMKNRLGEIIAQAELARNAEIREEAVRLVDEGRADDASSLLRRRVNDLKGVSAFSPAAAPMIAGEAEELGEIAGEIEESGSMSNEQRKETVNKAYKQKNQQNDGVK
jgi:Ca-activated chloride channel family protein